MHRVCHQTESYQIRVNNVGLNYNENIFEDHFMIAYDHLVLEKLVDVAKCFKIKFDDIEY